MKSLNTIKVRLTSLALVVFFIFSGLSAHAASLGISVNVDAKSDDSNRSSSKEIWFLGEQGSEITRRISVRGLSDIAQNLELRYYDSQVINGEKTNQQTELSKAQDWFQFNEESPSVEPGELKTFEIVATIPLDAREELLEGLMVVIATPKEEVVVDAPEGGTVGIITAEAGIAIPFKLAIGDLSDLQPLFSIQDVEGVLIDGEKYLRTFFRNEGTVPVILAGSVQLSDAVFPDRLFGPYEYRSREIAAGALGFIDIVADEEIDEGDYSAFVTAEQLGVKESRVFDVYIEYLSPGTLKFWDLAPWIGLVLVSGILMVVGVRLFRSSSKEDPDLETPAKSEKLKQLKNPKVLKGQKADKAEPPKVEKVTRTKAPKIDKAEAPKVEKVTRTKAPKIDKAEAPKVEKVTRTKAPKVEKAKGAKAPKVEPVSVAKAPKPEKIKAVKQPRSAPPKKTQREPIEKVRPKTPTAEELLASLKLKDAAQKPRNEPKAEKPIREAKAKRPKSVKESSTPKPASFMPPPPELDPWDFLRAGREGRWNDDSLEKIAKKKPAARKPNNKKKS